LVPANPASAPIPASAAARQAGPVTPAVTTTMKVCPRCAAHNRWVASVCAKCGYRFSGQTAPKAAQTSAAKARPLRRHFPPWWLWGVGLLLFVSFFGVRRFTSGSPPPTRQPTSTSSATAGASQPTSTANVAAGPTPNVLQQALVSVIQVVVPNDEQANSASIGSGSVVSMHGHILTNFHVLGDEQTHQLHNQAGIILIAVPPQGQSTAPPVIRYRAELVQADYVLDLALLRISAMQDGRALPPDLGLIPLPIGDSDTVLIGDELTIIGYPGLGGATVTITRGIVAGYLLDEGWLKTDAEINPGNSGGAAINRAGQLVGIPSAETRAPEAPGKLGLVRPINLAQDLLALAQ